MDKEDSKEHAHHAKEEEVSNIKNLKNSPAQEEIAIDFRKITSFFKRKAKDKESKDQEAHDGKNQDSEKSSQAHSEKSSQIHSEKSHQEEDKKEKQEPDKENKEKNEQELSFTVGDLKSVGKGILHFIKQHKTIFLILIPLLFALLIRVQPLYMPVTNDWAVNTVNNAYRSQISAAIDQQYPNLPSANRNSLIDAELNKFKEQQRNVYDQQVANVADQLRQHFKDEKGQTYLSDIDTWYWYRYSLDVIDHGFMGDKEVNGTYIDMHMLAPNGRPIRQTLHPYFGAYLYKVVKIFNRDTTPMGVIFFSQAIIAILSVIPAFFLGRKLGGPMSGFFSAMLIAVHPTFMSRTLGGTSDTDAYSIFFSLLIFFFFIQAMTAEERKRRLLWAILSGVSIGLFSFAWEGWWYAFDFILAITGIYFCYLLFQYRNDLKKELLHGTLRDILLTVILFIAVAGISISLITNVQTFTESVRQPLSFINLKAATQSTVIWPNVYTTVAELNDVSTRQVVDIVSGGRTVGKILMSLAILGIILLVLKAIMGKGEKEEHSAAILYSLLLVIWFLGTWYAATKGIRFVMLAIPPFVLAVSMSLSLVEKKVSSFFEKELHVPALLTSAISVIIFLFLIGVISLLPPSLCKHGMCAESKYMGYASTPSYNDAWEFTLVKIKENSKEDAIINSWWDFGHWFKAGADRAVTFDGASQNRPHAHWMGKVLLTDNEAEAVGILRMLDCGGNDAFEILDKELKNPVKTVNLLYEIIVKDKKEAKAILEKQVPKTVVEQALQKTHCNPPENFFITSEDMISKSGVWAHFGGWNFERASAWANVGKEKQSMSEGKKFLMDNLGYDEKTAEETYFSVQSLTSEQEANNWISPWPAYQSATTCPVQNNIATCQHGIPGQSQPFVVSINLADMTAVIENTREKYPPFSLAYMDQNNKFQNKVLFTKQSDLENPPIGFSLALFPAGEGQIRSLVLDYRLAGSMFTRLFYFQDNGGLDHFDFFGHQAAINNWNIYTWKIDWEGKQEDQDIRSQPLIQGVVPEPSAPE
ncbi:glycosyltransferase family 39 protein [Candidatus Woesearchaeota archaeon]|nr:glycosyltransferase family 39 protein [Candidatus Woesearchaeota archaeon]